MVGCCLCCCRCREDLEDDEDEEEDEEEEDEEELLEPEELELMLSLLPFSCSMPFWTVWNSLFRGEMRLPFWSCQSALALMSRLFSSSGMRFRLCFCLLLPPFSLDL